MPRRFRIIPLPMADQGPNPETSNPGPSGKIIIIALAVFLLAALLSALFWFSYAGRHGLSATPNEGPSGVGGMTAGDKGGKKH